MGVGQYTYFSSILSIGTPLTTTLDFSHGIPNAIVNLQSMNPDGTWTTVYTDTTQNTNVGLFMKKPTPEAAGVYTYRATHDGDSQYASAVSTQLH